MRSTPSLIVAGVLFFFLLWFWPNAVHEELHLVGLKLQGAQGSINFDWGHVPAAPSITRSGIQTIVGGLFFLLLPSIVAIVLLCIFALRKAPGIVATTIGIYLAFDLIVNITTYKTVTSDYHFLVAVPAHVVIILVVVLGAGALGTEILIKHLRHYWSEETK